MRLWTIHPQYLDSQGLVALWREGLLAQQVLLGKTQGYKNHPQINRFKSVPNPIVAIGNYLRCVADEADKRGYEFKRDKIAQSAECMRIPVTEGQVEYEFRHLLSKLAVRDHNRYDKLRVLKTIETHPLFVTVSGGVEDWEVIH